MHVVLGEDDGGGVGYGGGRWGRGEGTVNFEDEVRVGGLKFCAQTRGLYITRLLDS